MAEPYIVIRGLTQRFGDHEVLKGIDLEIFPGEILVILGTSGGGKSVLLKHLPGLLQPQSGSVTVDGVDISTLGERELGPMRRQMGIMFQGGALFDSFTVEENVAFPLHEQNIAEVEISKRVVEALEIVRLTGHGGKFPAELSGGMRKRVALARAVVSMPKCVLYDEPHAGLDPMTAATIDHLIRDLQRKYAMTSVVITHEMKSVFRIADRVAFIDQGRIVWIGTPEELRTSADPLVKAFVEGEPGETWD